MDKDGGYKTKGVTKAKKQKLKDSKTLFVGGFSFTTTHLTIKKIFSKYGKIKKIKMIKNKNGTSKGYCFILFKSADTVLKVIEQGQVICEGRELSCRPILKGKELQDYMEKINQKRVVVDHIPKSFCEMKKTELIRLFKTFGLIENAYFVKVGEADEDHEISNDELLITFRCAESAENALEKMVVFEGIVLRVQKYKKSQSLQRGDNGRNNIISIPREEEGEEDGEMERERDLIANGTVTWQRGANGGGSGERRDGGPRGEWNKNEGGRMEGLSTLESILRTSSSLLHFGTDIRMNKAN
jgi:RNA recognition motif-containing protein